MLNYYAHVQVSKYLTFALIIQEKKDSVSIIDSFVVSMQDYVSPSGMIMYPLVFAEDIAMQLNDKYPIKEITLVVSPNELELSSYSENLLTKKEAADSAKEKISSFRKSPVAYDMSWFYSGEILDDGPARSIFMNYCYPTRETLKLKRAFEKNNISVASVILEDIATIALFQQYINDYTDPNFLILESGFSTNQESATSCYWYKRNILEEITTLKSGIDTIIKDYIVAFPDLTAPEILNLMINCGIHEDGKTIEASDILELNGVNELTWFATGKRAFHTLATALKAELKRKNQPVDKVILTGILASLPGIANILEDEYDITPVQTWENEYSLQVNKKTILYESETKLSPIFSALIGSIYMGPWLETISHGSMAKKSIYINVNRFRRIFSIGLIVSLLAACGLIGPDVFTIVKTKANIKDAETNVANAQIIEAEITKQQTNIKQQQELLALYDEQAFNLKDFMYSAILLKPEDITIISIDTDNFLEEEGINMQAYYYVRKAVESMRESLENGSIYKPTDIDISGKDWTFGLPWDGIDLTEKNIADYLQQNSITNTPEYIIPRVIIRGSGSMTSITEYIKDITNVTNVIQVDTDSVQEKTIIDGNGSEQLTNIFEISVWFGGEK